jgi:hypothetical protein
VAAARHHRSVAEPTGSIQSWVDGWNQDPRPFVWTKTAHEILDSLHRYLQRINDSGHQQHLADCRDDLAFGHARTHRPRL